MDAFLNQVGSAVRALLTYGSPILAAVGRAGYAALWSPNIPWIAGAFVTGLCLNTDYKKHTPALWGRAALAGIITFLIVAALAALVQRGT